MIFIVLGAIGFYNLGKTWGLENQIKIIMGVGCILVITISFIQTHLKK
jgi:low affinity Fe/Cu permease